MDHGALTLLIAILLLFAFLCFIGFWVLLYCKFIARFTPKRPQRRQRIYTIEDGCYPKENNNVREDPLPTYQELFPGDSK